MVMSTVHEIDCFIRRGAIGAALAQAYGLATDTSTRPSDLWFTLGRGSGLSTLAVIMHALGGEVRDCQVRHLPTLLRRRLTIDEAAFFRQHVSSFQLPLAELSARATMFARGAVDRHIRDAQQGVLNVNGSQTHLGDVRMFWVDVAKVSTGRRYMLAVYGPVGLLRELMQAHSRRAGGDGMHTVLTDMHYHIGRDEFGPLGLAERRILIDVASGM